MSRNKVIPPSFTVPVESEPYYWHKRNTPRGYSFWSFLVPTGEDITNLAVNGSAEINLDRWEVPNPFDVGLTRETGSTISGGYSVCARSLVGFPQSMIVQYDMTNEWNDNQDYTVCVSVLAPNGIDVGLDTFNLNDGPALSSLPFDAPCRDQPLGSNRATSDGLNWKRLCMYIPAQTLGVGDPALISVLIGEPPAITEGPVYIDGLMIVEGRRSIEYFDGGTVGATWNGAEHASTSTLSRFATGSGERFYLSELGLDIFADSGWGMPPIDLVTRNFARFDGAELTRVRKRPRTISISGTVESCPVEMHRRRCALIEALSYRFDEICPQEIMLCYQVFDDCGDAITKELAIPVKYQSGLEGLRNALFSERISVQLQANTQVDWAEKSENSVVVNRNTITNVLYEGTAPAPMIVEWRAGPVDPMRIFEMRNDTSVTQLVFIDPDNGGIAGKPIIAGRSNIVNTTPASFEFYTPGAANPDQLRFVDYGQSDISLLRLVPGNNQLYFEWQGDESEVILRWKNHHVSVDCAAIVPGREECC